MAGVKGRSGRKPTKNKTRAAATKKPSVPVINPPENPPEENPENQGLLGKLGSMFSSSNSPAPPELRILPATESPEENPQAGKTTSKTTTEFDRAAAEIDDKYGSGASAAQPDAGPGVEMPEAEYIPPESEFISDETMRKFLRAFFTSMENRHGSHWYTSDSEINFLAPFNKAALDEFMSKWEFFKNSQYKACITCAAVMGIFVATKSKAGEKLIQWIMDKIASVGSKTAGPTRTASQE